mgnify:CR=1 FL=1
MTKKTITIELNEWQLEQVRTIINALKEDEDGQRMHYADWLLAEEDDD